MKQAVASLRGGLIPVRGRGFAGLSAARCRARMHASMNAVPSSAPTALALARPVAA